MLRSLVLVLISTGLAAAQPRWVQKPSVPPEPSGRYVGDGAWLAGVPSADSIAVYAAKGNRTTDFYLYTSGSDTWNQSAPIPLGMENKAVDQGAKGLWDGGNSLYMTKGNNSNGFYRFDISGDSWTQLPDVPLGPDSQRLRGGSDIVLVRKDTTPYVYLLKGESGEFYRFDLDMRAWESLPHAPDGAQPGWFDGSWLVSDGADLIYAHKSRADEFWAFDLTAGAWRTEALTGMPLIGRRGVPTPASHGSCAAWFGGLIYAFKGNDSPEFWRYLPRADMWEELDAAPIDIGGGGALTPGDTAPGGERYLYVLRGNQYGDFWQYRAAPSGIAGEGGPAMMPKMRVAPNPVTGGWARLSYALSRSGWARLGIFDVVGRSRWSSEARFSTTGEMRLDLRSLESGVFLLRCAEQGRTGTERMVVLR